MSDLLNAKARKTLDTSSSSHFRFSFQSAENATRLVNILGKTGTSIVTRLSAFILMAIGKQILLTGLYSGLPSMLAPVLSH